MTIACCAIWVGEATGKESIANASVLLAGSERIVVATGIASIWARDPIAMANAGRTIPIKVEMFANGVEKSRGQAALSIVGCAGGETLAMPLSWDGGRWTGHIDTGMLGGGCYRVTASLDANDAGSFRLDLRGADTAGGTTTGRPKR